MSTVAWGERGHQGRRVIIQIEPLAPDYPLGTPHHHHGAHVSTSTHHQIPKPQYHFRFQFVKDFNQIYLPAIDTLVTGMTRPIIGEPPV